MSLQFYVKYKELDLWKCVSNVVVHRDLVLKMCKLKLKKYQWPLYRRKIFMNVNLKNNGFAKISKGRIKRHCYSLCSIILHVSNIVLLYDRIDIIDMHPFACFILRANFPIKTFFLTSKRQSILWVVKNYSRKARFSWRGIYVC